MTKGWEKTKSVCSGLDNISGDTIDMAAGGGKVGSTGSTTSRVGVYAGAQMFKICDIVNRAAILARDHFFVTRCDEFDVIGNRGDEQHAAAALC